MRETFTLVVALGGRTPGSSVVLLRCLDGTRGDGGACVIFLRFTIGCRQSNVYLFTHMKTKKAGWRSPMRARVCAASIFVGVSFEVAIKQNSMLAMQHGPTDEKWYPTLLQ